MRHEAAARARISAAGQPAADDLGEGGASGVPALRAAELIDVADTRAADLVLAASRLRMLFEATSRARAVPAVARDAQCACGAHAGRIPLNLAAERVGIAHD